jgi:hypothetical protein
MLSIPRGEHPGPVIVPDGRVTRRRAFLDAPAFAKASRDARSVYLAPRAPLPARIAANRTAMPFRWAGTAET